MEGAALHESMRHVSVLEYKEIPNVREAAHGIKAASLGAIATTVSLAMPSSSGRRFDVFKKGKEWWTH